MMSKYFITLKPVEKFFFGGDINFFSSDTYIVKSNIFPQQTTILGMLRKEILIIKNLIKRRWEYDEKDKEKIKEIIGKNSFNVEENNEQNFGIINSISPIYLYDGKDLYIKIPKDHKIGGQEYTLLEFSKNKYKTSFGDIRIPNDYDAKAGISNDFLNISSLEVKKFCDIFKEDERVGIKKGKNGKTEEDAYFKEISYRLIDNFMFAFEVEIKDDAGINLNDYKSIVTIGSAESMFILEAERIEETKINFNEQIYKSNNKIILLSDAYVDDRSIYEMCYFTICDAVEFKNITTNYSRQNKLSKTSDNYIFLERGSVLFPKEEKLEEVKNLLNKPNLVKVGYNVFIIV